MWRMVFVLAAIGVVSILSYSQIPNPDTLIVAAVGDLDTLDPAWAYDTASCGAIFNIYETLVFYDGEYVDQFIPLLAESWTVSWDGLAYVFQIRRGVKFHEGGDLTPEDVVYSLQRALIQDRVGGPIWMMLDPIFGVSSIEELAEKLGSDEAVYEALQRAIRAQGNQVIITLDHPYGPFIQILAGTWASIVDKEWVIAQGGWDGTANWRKWYDPLAEDSELFNKANGTGPFMLEQWVPGAQISFTRNESYWRERARLQRVVIQTVPAWGTRLAMFQAGAADIISVPRQYVAQMDVLVAQGKARMMGPFPTSICQTGFFNFYVTEESPFVPYLGDEPQPHLLADLHLRRAINYALDIDAYIGGAWLGEAWQLTGVIPTGRLGYDPNLPKYTFDLAEAEEELRLAWDGQLWKKGFRLTITYNSGNEPRKLVATMLKRTLESFNQKRQAEGLRGMFVIEVQDLPWPSYLKYMDAGQLSLFFLGWFEDYAHPDNWVRPYMHSTDAFAMNQHFDTIKDVEFTPVYATWLPTKTYDTLQDLFDELITLASRETDFAKAEKLYFELNRLAHEWAINVGHIQLLARHYQQLWVHGWYFNPAFPGEYFYALWKG